jgi:RNA polymerase sigma-70 factor (ECF subfamily)
MQPDPDDFAYASPDIEHLMARYQQADPVASAALIKLLSPQLYRFFAGRMGTQTDAEDMLQDVWLRIRPVRQTYRPGEPVLETCVDVLQEPSVSKDEKACLPRFEELVAALPESQREVVTMLKVDGLSIEAVARATSSAVGAVKEKAHRAYERLRKLLEHTQRAQTARKGAAQ